jgi:glutamate/tyrosine decarboxylase-like PLP-dependent enzyme
VLASGLAELDGVEILNDVVYTQVCMTMPDDARTIAVGQRLREDGVVLASPSRWRDREVLRFSVSNWATDGAEIAATVAAVRRALAGRQ